MKKLLNNFKSINKLNWHLVLMAFYFAAYSVMNIIAVKTYAIRGLSITAAGTFIFSWITFLCMDLFTEVWGKKSAIKTFCGAALLNIVFTLIFQVCILIPGDPDMQDVNEAFAKIFSFAPRILSASIIAFLIGNYINAAVMDKMRAKAKDENNKVLFSLRAIVSTVFGQLIDNALFFIVAFAPIGFSRVEMPWELILQMIAFTTIIEIILESMMSPLTAKFAVYLKKKPV